MSWFKEAGFGDFSVFGEDRRGWRAARKKMPAVISSAEGVWHEQARFSTGKF